MNRKVFLALIIWAIDRDALNFTVEKAWTLFLDDARKCYETFTDPREEDLYCPNLVGMSPVDVFADYTLKFAKACVQSHIKNYGRYNYFITIC